MIASFYDLRHATIAFNTLNAFLALSDGFVCYAKPEILQGLTNKTVLVEMKGPFNILSKFNFMVRKKKG
jgi:hypothetical protein